MKALSIRQPWAWLIVNGYKDIENRDWYIGHRGELLVHAAKGMTRDEYEDAQSLCHSMNPPINLPAPDDLERGGIVGSTNVTGCVRESESPWFFGKFGAQLKDSKPLPFRPYRGQLGLFEVQA